MRIIWNAGLIAVALVLLTLSTVRAADAYNRFNIGISGIWGEIAPSGDSVTVLEIVPNTPASGVFEKGDVITAVNGLPLKGNIGDYILGTDPRRILGEAIGKAEASDGKMVFSIRRGAEAKDVTISLPVLGAYGKDWPINCRKSEAIIKQQQAYLHRIQKADGSFDFGFIEVQCGDQVGSSAAGLFLLSTDNPDDSAAAGRYARYINRDFAEHGVPPSNWPLGHLGIFLAEYYLKTGDKAALAPLTAFCKAAAERQFDGGYGHGAGVAPKYSLGGQMSLPSLMILTARILARECNVDVDEASFRSSLHHFSRFIGADGASYGDQRGDGGCSNGKDGVAAIAFSLLTGKDYKQISELAALQNADSYYGTQQGHGCCYFNVLWRGVGEVHLPEKLYSHYRKQMDELAWFYDLSRLPGGGFEMLPQGPGAGGAGSSWGFGMALAYTAPRHTLRITGGKPTKYSVAKAEPPYLLGGKKDRDFLRTDYCAGGETNTMTPAEIERDIYYFLNGPKGKPSVETCALLMRHYLPHFRNWAANNISYLGTPEALDEIEKALQHSDARVRRAGLNAIVNYLGSWFTANEARNKVPNDMVEKRFMPYIAKVLDNPESDWWEIDGAMFALSKAGPDNVRKYLPLLKKYAVDGEMWLRQSAFYAITKGLDQKMDPDTMLFLAGCYAREGREFLRCQMQANLQLLTRNNKNGKGVQFDAAKVAALMAGPITNTMWSPEIVKSGVSRNDPAYVLDTIRDFSPKELLPFFGDFSKVVDSWKDMAFLDADDIAVCERLIAMSLTLGNDARPIMEKIARIYHARPAMHRAMGKVDSGIKDYEKKFGPLKENVPVPLVAVNYDTRGLRQGLIGYWQCDEGAGAESADSSSNKNKAFLKGGAGWTNGVFGKALLLSKGQWAEIPGYQDPLKDGRIQNLSLSFWIRTADYGSGRIGKGKSEFFRKNIDNWYYSYDARGAGWDVRLPDEGMYAFITGAFDNGQHGLTAMANNEKKIPDHMFLVVDDGKRWHHVVVVYDGSLKTWNAWVDGCLSGQDGWNKQSLPGIETANHIIPALNDILKIGGSFEKEGQLESFDEIAIWDRVISDKEVQMLFNNGFGSVIGRESR